MQDEIARHLADWHTYDKGEVAQMVKEHKAMVKDLGMMIDDLYFGKLTPRRIESILKSYRDGS